MPGDMSADPLHHGVFLIVFYLSACAGVYQPLTELSYKLDIYSQFFIFCSKIPKFWMMIFPFHSLCYADSPTMSVHSRISVG